MEKKKRNRVRNVILTKKLSFKRNTFNPRTKLENKAACFYLNSRNLKTVKVFVKTAIL